MDPFIGLIVFFLIWWTLLFAVLPFGHRRDVDGTPVQANIKRKFLWTTLVSVAVWLVLFALIKSDLISFRRMAAQAAEPATFCQQVDVEFKTDHAVPADVGGGLTQPILDPIRIPVEIDQIAEIEGLNLEPDVAFVEIYQDGSVLYNGQDISSHCDPKVPVHEKPVDPEAIESEILEGQFP